MEIGHDDEADNDGNDAKKLDAVKAADTVSETVRDLTIKNDNGGTSGGDKDAEDEPTNGKFPRHKVILTWVVSEIKMRARVRAGI